MSKRKKYRSNSVSIEVDVDVDLELFETDDLIEELAMRIEHGDDADISGLIPLINSGDFKVSSIVDQMKLEYVTKILDKYSLSDLITKLPEL